MKRELQENLLIFIVGVLLAGNMYFIFDTKTVTIDHTGKDCFVTFPQ